MKLTAAPLAQRHGLHVRSAKQAGNAFMPDFDLMRSRMAPGQAARRVQHAGSVPRNFHHVGVLTAWLLCNVFLLFVLFLLMSRRSLCHHEDFQLGVGRCGLLAGKKVHWNLLAAVNQLGDDADRRERNQRCHVHGAVDHFDSGDLLHVIGHVQCSGCRQCDQTLAPHGQRHAHGLALEHGPLHARTAGRACGRRPARVVLRLGLPRSPRGRASGCRSGGLRIGCRLYIRRVRSHVLSQINGLRYRSLVFRLDQIGRHALQRKRRDLLRQRRRR